MTKNIKVYGAIETLKARKKATLMYWEGATTLDALSGQIADLTGKYGDKWRFPRDTGLEDSDILVTYGKKEHTFAGKSAIKDLKAFLKTVGAEAPAKVAKVTALDRLKAHPMYAPKYVEYIKTALSAYVPAGYSVSGHNGVRFIHYDDIAVEVEFEKGKSYMLVSLDVRDKQITVKKYGSNALPKIHRGEAVAQIIESVLTQYFKDISGVNIESDLKALTTYPFYFGGSQNMPSEENSAAEAIHGAISDAQYFFSAVVKINDKISVEHRTRASGKGKWVNAVFTGIKILKPTWRSGGDPRKVWTAKTETHRYTLESGKIRSAFWATGKTKLTAYTGAPYKGAELEVGQEYKNGDTFFRVLKKTEFGPRSAKSSGTGGYDYTVKVTKTPGNRSAQRVGEKLEFTSYQGWSIDAQPVKQKKAAKSA